MLEKNKEYTIVKENLVPLCVKSADNVSQPDALLREKPACVSFGRKDTAIFSGKGAYVILDYGKELCGSLRFITADTGGENAFFRVTLGESLTEACSSVENSSATNDHAPREFTAQIAGLSDLTVGQSGFRFAKVELISEKPVMIYNIFAVSTLPYFEKEGYLHTGDPELDRIAETAAYTLKLTLQNGYIWDGIKRDRLVWAGDLNPEILVATYLYGDIVNVPNSLRFLAGETPADAWINFIPSYSAWWVINLCDYCRLTNNQAFYAEQRQYALDVIANFDRCIADSGEMDFSVAPHYMAFFLDWPTADTPDAKIGTASLIVYMAKKFLQIEENSNCHSIVAKLERYLSEDCSFKQTRAFQILAGRDGAGEAAFLEKDGASGMSTFMAYYILKADAMAGGKKMLSMVKEYFGGMLKAGATTFWEDFDLQWLDGSATIDELPAPGQKDMHADHGAYCYIGLRHSLCHGWASGVLAFLAEYLTQIPNPLNVRAELYSDGHFQTYGK